MTQVDWAEYRRLEQAWVSAEQSDGDAQEVERTRDAYFRFLREHFGGSH